METYILLAETSFFMIFFQNLTPFQIKLIANAKQLFKKLEQLNMYKGVTSEKAMDIPKSNKFMQKKPNFPKETIPYIFS